MKWQARLKPVLGERRSVIKFAWWPTEVSGGSVVWLECYTSWQTYISVMEEWYEWYEWNETSREVLPWPAS